MTPVKLVANGVGLFAVLVVGGWILMSLTSHNVTSVCAKRYETVTELGFRTLDGERMTPVGLQARAGFTEFGMLENTEVVDATGAQGFDDALKIKLAKGTGSGFGEKGIRGGASFSWIPHEMGEATSACLSYSVFVPKDFKFAEQGMLPGLFAGRDFDARAEPRPGTGSALRVGWSKEGLLSIMAQYANDNGWQYLPVARSRGQLPRGRWALVEQEIVLNRPGARDGMARLWIDGKLVGEQSAMLRRQSDIKIAGVLADVSFGSLFGPAKAAEDTQVLISPLSIRWKDGEPEAPPSTATHGDEQAVASKEVHPEDQKTEEPDEVAERLLGGGL
ncbi:MAG: hypothetical protein NW216_05945 [Hyphomicrobium sp.]|nr:hypothetical protein [Hyphomicrobium sp.]